MGGGRDNHHADKGCYPPTVYPPVHSTGSYAFAPPVAYPYPYAQHGSMAPPPLGSYPYPSPMYSSHSGYPPSGYPTYNQSAYPSMGGYPGGSLHATQHHGNGYNMGATLIGGAAATAAATYGVHHLTHGHHPHNHHLGHFGKFKHHYNGHYGKLKHGKFGKHIGLGGKHGLLGWKHHRHGFFGGKYKRWK